MLIFALCFVNKFVKQKFVSRDVIFRLLDLFYHFRHVFHRAFHMSVFTHVPGFIFEDLSQAVDAFSEPSEISSAVLSSHTSAFSSTPTMAVNNNGATMENTVVVDYGQVFNNACLNALTLPAPAVSISAEQAQQSVASAVVVEEGEVVDGAETSTGRNAPRRAATGKKRPANAAPATRGRSRQAPANKRKSPTEVVVSSSATVTTPVVTNSLQPFQSAAVNQSGDLLAEAMQESSILSHSPPALRREGVVSIAMHDVCETSPVSVRNVFARCSEMEEFDGELERFKSRTGDGLWVAGTRSESFLADMRLKAMNFLQSLLILSVNVTNSTDQLNTMLRNREMVASHNAKVFEAVNRLPVAFRAFIAEYDRVTKEIEDAIFPPPLAVSTKPHILRPYSAIRIENQLKKALEEGMSEKEMTREMLLQRLEKGDVQLYNKARRDFQKKFGSMEDPVGQERVKELIGELCSLDVIKIAPGSDIGDFFKQVLAKSRSLFMLLQAFLLTKATQRQILYDEKTSMASARLQVQKDSLASDFRGRVLPIPLSVYLSEN